ncbi:MAG: enoyl-CoA hydratase/isomerase family protein [Gammaproteobacteria bacterium]|nr:enoyl-CoA hydratase/isomerase family protein [Gammaproteobacteria bacterium]
MAGQDPLHNWRLERDTSGVAWLAIDVKANTVNVLSRAVMEELDGLLRDLETNPPAGLVLHSGKPGCFVAGADIHEFPAIQSAEEATELASRGQAIIGMLEALPCPSVAVLDGTALGGGLELALGTTWRLAVSSDRPTLGLPEVQLGLHPGLGGTVRLPRLVGVRKAMAMMLTGRSITVTEAVACGLVDTICELPEWREAAVALLSRPRPRRSPPVLDRLLASPLARSYVARSLEQKTRRKADPRHYPAPGAMIELWRKHAAQGPAAFAAEARSFGQLAVSQTSRNLVRVFFLQERLKNTGAALAVPARRVHVVGAGVMGGDIAAWCAYRGLDVTLQDREARFVEPALERAHAYFRRKIDDPARLEETRSRLRADVAGEGAADADVVIEAIFEDLQAKQQLFGALERRIRPGCILATNTSSIPLQDLMSCLANPGRLIGLHFFNPVASLPLVEVVQTDATDAAVLAAGLAFARQIGKLPLPCRSHPGFLVNRVLAPYLAEAMALVEEGVALPDIDRAATEFGMPMGPVELADSVGLDIALHVARILGPVIQRPVSPVLERMVTDGRLGRKAGKGFYLYHEGRPVKPQGSTSDIPPEIGERLVLALVNEAAQCLAEGIVADADLVDAGVIFGTGFAPFRGGPLHYARQAGIGSVTGRLQALAGKYGPRFQPSAGLEELARR